MGDFNGAFESFKKSYELEKSDENLLRIADVLLNKLNKKQDAITYLDGHRKFFGCKDKSICNALIEIYTRDNKIKDAIRINTEEYERNGDTSYLDNILGLYYSQENYDKMIEILKKYDYKTDTILSLYLLKNDYNSAIKFSRDEFAKTKESDFLINALILEYEKATNKNTQKIDKKTLDKIMTEFNDISDKIKTPEHLNYYGYLLIDHDIDIKKGLIFVEKALEKDAKSPYYLDSLAWGYYKLNECKKAKETMNKIVADDEFWNTDEAKEHIKDIDKCLNSNISKEIKNDLR